MTELMRLETDRCSATFDPSDGGRLTSFTVAGRELLVQHGVDMFHWGSFVIAPWVGRLRDGVLHFQGKDYQFPLNSPPHALHGFATERAWQVVGDGVMAVELTDPWPWPCRVTQSTVLTDNYCSFEIRLESEAPMPAAMGWHPWFVRRLRASDGRDVEIELNVEPGLMWDNDSVGLPSGELVRPVERPWDYCFRALTAPPSVRWPGVLELTLESSCEDWVFFDRDEPGICVEPWTGPPNSVNMAQPTLVGPEQPMSAGLTWRWREL